MMDIDEYNRRMSKINEVSETSKSGATPTPIVQEDYEIESTKKLTQLSSEDVSPLMVNENFNSRAAIAVDRALVNKQSFAIKETNMPLDFVKDSHALSELSSVESSVSSEDDLIPWNKSATTKSPHSVQEANSNKSADRKEKEMKTPVN